ncbi:MAG: DUF982 domain-containing protein, partial [Mesorhizobium sp.]
AAILLRDLHRQTEKRKAAMDACPQVLRCEAHPPAARKAFVAVALEARSAQRLAHALDLDLRRRHRRPQAPARSGFSA